MSVKPVAWTPWIVGEHKEWDKEIPIIGDTEHYKQAKFAWVDNDDICHGDDAETRARLIASAPELAGALQEIIESVDATELTYEAAYDLLKRGPWNKVRQLLARITPK